MQLPKANHKPHTSGVPPPEYLDEVVRDTQEW
jgi:hypothetical protein